MIELGSAQIAVNALGYTPNKDETPTVLPAETSSSVRDFPEAKLQFKKTFPETSMYKWVFS